MHPRLAKPRQSVEGHIEVVRELENKLIEREQLYQEKCSGGSSKGEATPSEQSEEGDMTNILFVGAGLARGGTCILFPEVCIPTVILRGCLTR